MAHNTLNYTFADLDLDFTKHPVSKDVAKKYDEEAVKTSVRNLIQTMHYERPFHPEIGSMVHSLLFENASPITATVMKRTIEDTLRNFEPRIRVLDVIILPAAPDRISGAPHAQFAEAQGQRLEDYNTYNVTIVFNVLTHNAPVELSLMLKEVR